MLRRLQSLQEQCRSRQSVPERPFCNIGQTSQRQQSPIVNGPGSLQQDFMEIVSCASTPKQASDLLPSNFVDIVVQSDQDLPPVTEKSGKRSHSEIDHNTVPVVDYSASPASSSPARKRSRQDTLESVASENVNAAAGSDASPSNVAVKPSEKPSAFVTSPADRSFDSTNVELSLSAVCEPSSASAASGFGRSGSCTQLNSLKPASVVRSANSSPRTWPSRRDLGQSFMHLSRVVLSDVFVVSLMKILCSPHSPCILCCMEL